MNTESFIAKAQKIHENEFLYAKTIFINWKTPLIIECLIHGPFRQWPETHLRGSGCRHCKGIKAQAGVVLQCSKSFIEKARKAHGDKYDYSKTNYNRSNKKVIVTCKIHGSFEIRASRHLAGKGCRFCSQALLQSYFLSDQSQKIASENSIAQPRDLKELFIERSFKIHGNRYDYKNVIYTNNRTKVNIVCSVHGSFMQLPHQHWRGAGCKPCADLAWGEERCRKAAFNFVEKAQAIHGSKYDYSKAIYRKHSIKLEIICLYHGSFFITPNSHLNGSGCDQCGNESARKKLSMGTEEFIVKAQAVHGLKYDYSKVEYVSNKQPIIIICSSHGYFTQAPSGHLSGNGCQACGIEKQANNSRDSIEDFIIRAKKMHGERYDYSKAIYKLSNEPLIIICPDHGQFLQRPDKHYIGHGCLSCANRDMDTEKFILRAKATHGNKYNYSKSIYKAAKFKITIICPDHGEFEQVAWNHMEGTGCELCVDQFNSRGVRRIESWLLANHISFIREKTFPELKSFRTGNKSLRFDFFIEKFNVLIEFDGEQHFRPNPFWGGEQAFQKLIENDKRKDIFARDTGYELIRISFKEIDHIQKILSSLFQVHFQKSSPINT